jgi:hypothetical protein
VSYFTIRNYFQSYNFNENFRVIKDIFTFLVLILHDFSKQMPRVPATSTLFHFKTPATVALSWPIYFSLCKFSQGFWNPKASTIIPNPHFKPWPLYQGHSYISVFPLVHFSYTIISEPITSCGLLLYITNFISFMLIPIGFTLSGIKFLNFKDVLGSTFEWWQPYFVFLL